ncbi:TPA: ead/Ea22-like family protein [Enterobacter hormaechei subsp. steigerwaltii]|nr:ead/Ea22-like family protein [Enterobacter hormaechei subsp. steigerwaltii]
MNVKRYEWVACDEHACHCDVVESAEGDMVDYEDYAALEARCAALAAENALLKKSEPAPFSKLMMEALDVYQAGADEVPELAMLSAYKKLREGLKTPATEAILAEVRAQGRNEGINYAASRLAAAYNHGFIGKSMSEVADVVHMILDTKEELANSTLPAADGLSGEYAEEFLEDSAAQIRQEAAQ